LNIEPAVQDQQPARGRDPIIAHANALSERARDHLCRQRVEPDSEREAAKDDAPLVAWRITGVETTQRLKMAHRLLLDCRPIRLGADLSGRCGAGQANESRFQ
jgi:hypothetical protein